MDGWSAGFLVAFLVGVVFTGVGFLLGGAHHGVHLGHHAPHGPVHHAPNAHASHSSHPSHAQQHDNGGLSPFNPLMLAALVGTGGGIAFLLHHSAHMHAGLAALVGVVAGLALATALFQILVRVFIRGAGGSTRSAYSVVDSAATVSVAVSATGTGRIDFVAAGQRQTMAARSATGAVIPKGSPVVVLRLERGIAYVAPMGGKERTWA